MKKNDTANRPFSSLGTRSFHAGGYSVAAAVIVLAIAVAVNALVGNLPSTYTKLDTTANGLYTVSEQTEKVLSGLDEDIDIYWIVRSGYEDSNIATLLDRYSSQSDKISVTKKDPDVYPTFAKQYYDDDDETVLPRSIATKEAFENAMTMDVAMGGSTNTVLHILAMAQSADVDFTLDDIERISHTVPCICKASPSGEWEISDVHRAGGITGILGELDRAGKLHRDVHSIDYKTLEDKLND